MQQQLPRKQFDPDHRGALAGLKVLDLSRLVAGNMMTLQLADLGADVVKVEPTRGDTLRAFRTAGVEVFWKAYCRNKRSICLDFRHADAAALIGRLAGEADVLVESFRPGVLEEMGLGPDALLAANPKLIIARISGWGQTGKYRHKPGFGTLVEGYSGFAAMNGFEDREPVLPPMFLGDMTTGLYGFGAVMSALWHVSAQGGRGQVIDLSLFDPTLSILGPQAANYRLTGKVKRRTGSRSSTTAPRNVYRTRDGHWVCLSTSTQTMAERLFESIGHGEMNQDPRFDSNASRLRHVDEVNAVVSEFVGSRDLKENLAFFDAAEVTIGPVYDVSQLMDDEYVAGRESLVELPDDELGHMPMHNVVPRLSRTPGGFRRPAPRKGQHSREVLEPLLGAEEYQRLVTAGLVHPEQ